MEEGRQWGSHEQSWKCIATYGQFKCLCMESKSVFLRGQVASHSHWAAFL